MPNISYIQGEVARLTASFVDDDGDPANPTAVVCSLRDPAGVVTNPPTTNPSVGSYLAEVDTTSLGVGRYRYEFAGTGAVQSVTSPRYFYVEAAIADDEELADESVRTPVTGSKPYCTAEEFLLHVDREFAGQLAGDAGRIATADQLLSDGVLEEVLKRASGRIEAACLRGHMYDAADLAKIMSAGGNSAAYLRGLCADVAVGLLRDRRVFDDQNPLPAVQRAERDLKDLAGGVQIFAFLETQDAGTPTHRFLTRSDLQRVNLPTLDSRYWGSRTRDGRPSYGY